MPEPRNHFRIAALFSVVAAWLISTGWNIADAADEKKPATPPAAKKKAEGESSWTSLFDGKSLANWKATDFAGHGEVRVEKGQMMLDMGVALTGVTLTNTNLLPRIDYEVELDAMKMDGVDFFCGLTMPVDKEHCTLICGGWGGAVVGISSIDGMDASENDTTKFVKFDKGHWYHIRVRVAKDKIECWIDNEKLVDQDISGRKISMRPGEIEEAEPFGLSTWQTSSAIKNIRVRRLESAKK